MQLTQHNNINNRVHHLFAQVFLLLLLCISATNINAAPGDILFSDDFETGSLSPTRWSVDNSGGGDAGVSANNNVSGSRSMFTRWDDVFVTSTTIDTNKPGATVSMWIRRGDDDLDPDSEDTDNGEDLVIEYLDNVGAGNWIVLDNFLGGVSDGQIFIPTYTLPSDALHANFQLRFHQTNGSGNSGNGATGYDYWHVDDVVITETIAFDPLISYYALDEAAWGTVVDGTGNGNDGSAVGNAIPLNTSPVVSGTPGTCSYADFPLNTDDDEYDAIDTGVNINTIGNKGTISFWYKSNEAWNGSNEDRMLLDASTTENGQKYFFLMLQDDSQLRFGLEDTNDSDFTLDTGNNNFSADEWVHIAITWDMPGDSMEIYINGNMVVDSNPNTNGLLGDMDTIYLGDNRSTYQASGSSGRSANGSIDEVYFYSEVRSATQIQENRDAKHPCAVLPSTCGSIPSTYPVYSAGQNLDIGDDGGDNVTIDIGDGNGFVAVQQGDNNGRAIDVTPGNVGDVITPSPAPTLPTIEPSSFPATGSLDVTIPDGNTLTFDSAVEDSYDNIRVGDDATANFVGGGPFYIDQLRADDDTTINLNTGTYFIDQLEIHGDGTVTINVNGPVRLFIGDHFITVGSNTDNLIINKSPNSGDVSNLVVFLYPNAEVDMDDVNLDFTGVFYGPQSGEIDIEEDSVITGAIIGGGEIDLDDDVKLIYTPAVAAAVDDITTCAIISGHYEITHNGPGITCAPTTITISSHDDGDNPLALPAGTVITVSIDNNTANLGSWSGTGVTPVAPNSAEYTFDGIQTSADLDLLYPQTGTININVSDGTYIESEDPPLVIDRAKLLFSTINTQISGKPSDTGFGAQTIYLQAIIADESDATICVPGFPDGSTRSIDFGAECNNPSTCAGQSMTINTIPVPTSDNNLILPASVYTPVDLLFGTNATSEIIINYPDAGQMSLHAKYNVSGTDPTDIMNGTSGSSGEFVVRPFAYRLSAAGNPGETTITEGVNIFRDAGENFDIQLEAVSWQQSDDTNNDGVPDNYIYDNTDAFSNLLLVGNNITPNFGNESTSETANLTTTVVAPAGGVNGTLSTASASFINGISTTTTSWNEVGAMTIKALTNDYLSGGQEIEGISASIGRFHPAQYEVSLPLATEACVNFTYSRQPFNELITIKAQSVSGSTTNNYQGGFVTLDSNDTDELPFRNDQTLPLPLEAYDSQISTVAPDFSTGTLGEAMIDVELTWNMGEQAETTSTVQMLTTSTDDGGIAIVPGGMPDLNDLGSSLTRFGRLNLTNAFGSELLALNVPVTAEYFNGSSYILNTDDNCTTRTDLPAAAPVWGDITLPTASYTDNLAEGDTTPSITGLVTGGVDTITLTAPGAGNEGSVTVNLAAPAWLLFDWDGDGTHDNDPSATATFGIFHGNDATIYRRELY